jgi:hypothetical protein
MSLRVLEWMYVQTHYTVFVIDTRRKTTPSPSFNLHELFLGLA